MAEKTSAAGTGRLSVPAFAGLVVGYLVIVQGLGALLTRDIDVDYAAPTTTDALWRSITLPVGAGLVLVVVVVTALRWWRPVLVDDRPVRSWVAVVPVVMLVATVLATDYAGLADRGLGFTLLLLVSALAVGCAEEGLFRGVGLVAFRAGGFGEARVALWTSVIFALAHASNLITAGPKAFLQVLVTAVAGYFLYLVRRRTGNLVATAVVHGLWDFSLISSAVVPDRTYIGPDFCVLALVVLAIVVFVRRHDIEPATETTEKETV
ncbi:MAG TPA: CPBP family intramembrane glutamic endopeptidase [Actinophytocola sp.]|jgi:membrane protease YdiL (CAAX protease family)|nr:CPBP family intramembrane glutamic endopeptidase [Actinophytocola sp.]